MREEILTLARIVSGAGEAEEALLESLCQAARLRWEGRLRQGLTPEDCGRAFACAAAFTAAADLAAGGDGVASFSAGDISVRLEGGGERAGRAESLRQAAERLMEPFVRAEGLWAQGVEG